MESVKCPLCQTVFADQTEVLEHLQNCTAGKTRLSDEIIITGLRSHSTMADCLQTIWNFNKEQLYATAIAGSVHHTILKFFLPLLGQNNGKIPV
jgi:hypothetical protein